MVVRAVMRERVDLSACLGKINNVLVTSDFDISLIADEALERAALAARCRRDFVDEMLYPGHSPDEVEEERK